jgi:cysteinyl-tRNA synthetase
MHTGMLKIHNSLKREKQLFVPIEANKVRMYVCGMTVYDYCHLGHARVMVVFDMVYRWLKASGYDVTYVRNITDIDDKIIKRAIENGETIQQLTDRFIAFMHEDADALGVLRPDHEPRATEYVPEMLDLIGKLEQNGSGLSSRATATSITPCASSPATASCPASRSTTCAPASASRSIRQAGSARFRAVEACQAGRAGLGVAWGEGRPGWHIECSAMSSKLARPAFRHPRRRPGSAVPAPRERDCPVEGANCCSFVNYWMHNGFVRVDNEKMSKSLGNFFTIREVLEKFDAEVVRFFILRAHYRSPLNYSDAHLDDAKRSLDSLYFALRDVPPAKVDIDWQNDYAARFAAALNEDFDSHGAIAVLFELAGEVNRQRSAEAGWPAQGAGRRHRLARARADGLSAGRSRGRRPG